MNISIAGRRVASLASASAIIATMALATAPAATMAASCTPTGFIRDGIDLTAKQINGPVVGELDATGCDIAVYNPDSVTNADIHDARYYGVVVNGLHNVNITGSNVHQIGENPFDGTQHGRAILYIDGATGTISGNRVHDFQKNGIEVRGVTADASAPSAHKTSAMVVNNVVTGQGPVDYIAQNGIVVVGNASATVKGNTVRDLVYTPADTEATGLLNVDVDADSVFVARNTFANTEVAIYGPVTANVSGHSTITRRPHGVHIVLRSGEQPAAETTLGDKLDWRIKVDGKTALHIKQGFGARDAFNQRFAADSGRHVIKVFKNDHLVRRIIVRS